MLTSKKYYVTLVENSKTYFVTWQGGQASVKYCVEGNIDWNKMREYSKVQNNLFSECFTRLTMH